MLSVGLLAPGLPDWARAVPVLRGFETYHAEPIDAPAPTILPANERRRTTLATRLALEAARQATSVVDLDPAQLLSVFASSEGDLTLIDRMCTDLYQHDSGVSPTVFHNSVHNAVAGYWSIGHRCHQASASLGGWNNSFAIGLLDGCVQALTSEQPVLLVAYDVPGPERLAKHRHFAEPVACALVLSGADRTGCTPLISIDVSLDTSEAPATAPSTGNADLDALVRVNPAALALPVLQAIANAAPAVLRLPYQDDLDLTVSVS